MKIVSWNVNSLRIRLQHVLDWVDANKPDALCLQETKVEDGLFPREPFEARGLNLAFHGQKSYNGVAIISPHPITKVSHGFNGHVFNDHARLISATVKGIRLGNAYVPHGESFISPKYAMKQEFYHRLGDLAVAEQKANPDYVLMGDFNVATDGRDVDDEPKRAASTLYAPDARSWLASFREKTGLADAFRLKTDEGGVFSWWDYRENAFAVNRGMRIDYHFVSPSLAPKVQAVLHDKAERVKDQPSDHVPVVLELAA